MHINMKGLLNKPLWRVAALVIFNAFAGVSTMSQSSGGPFVIEQSVIATGGGQSSGGPFTIGGTNGQSIAGTLSTGSQFTLYGGFWNAAPLGTTAALVPVGGRVITSGGQGVRGVIVTLTLDDQVVRRCLTGSFGYYRFDDVEAGQTVIISVAAKRFTFAQPSIVLLLTDSFTNVDFVANP